jgi:hypothetical protein
VYSCRAREDFPASFCQNARYSYGQGFPERYSRFRGSIKLKGPGSVELTLVFPPLQAHPFRVHDAEVPVRKGERASRWPFAMACCVVLFPGNAFFGSS